MSKQSLINVFKKNISNGWGKALYSNCGWGYVYEAHSIDTSVRVGLNQIVEFKSNSIFCEAKYDLTIDEFNKLSKDLPCRLLKIKLLNGADICTVRLRGSIDIPKK